MSEINPFTPKSAYYWMQHVHRGSVAVEYAGWYGTIERLGQAGYQGSFEIVQEPFTQEFAQMWEDGLLKPEDLPDLLSAIDQGDEQ